MMTAPTLEAASLAPQSYQSSGLSLLVIYSPSGVPCEDADACARDDDDVFFRHFSLLTQGNLTFDVAPKNSSGAPVIFSLSFSCFS
jgi:hypothetical protein